MLYLIIILYLITATISFETEDKKILDTIILAGINGSGKTTLLLVFSRHLKS